MIAVIGSVKETIRVKMRMPEEDDQQMPQEQSLLSAPVITDQQDDIMIRNSGGGVNIAAGLAAQGLDTAVISAAGNDYLGRAIKDELEELGVDVSGVESFDCNTAVDIEFVNILGDLEMVRGNREVTDRITPELIKKNEHILEGAEAIVVDGCIPEESVRYIAERYGKRDDVKLFYDPGNMSGSRKVKELLPYFYCIMPGRMEAETLTGGTVLSEEQLEEAGRVLSEKGVKRIVITIKGGGLYYKEGDAAGILRPERMITFGNTSGAGDAVSAAVTAASMAGKDIKTTAEEAMAKAADFLKDVIDEKYA